MKYKTLSENPRYIIYIDGAVEDTKDGDYKTIPTKIGSNGYKTVTIELVNGKKSTVALHRLYAAHFIPKTDNDLKYGRDCVRFVDGDKTNITKRNLEWASQREINLKNRLQKIKKQKITSGQFDFELYIPFIEELIELGYSYNEIFNVLELGKSVNSLWKVFRICKNF